MSCKWIGNYKYFETEQSKQHINEYEFGKDIYEIYTKNRKVIACLSLNCIQKIKNINFYLYRNKKNGFDEKLSLGSPSNVNGFFLFSLKKAVNKVI